MNRVKVFLRDNSVVEFDRSRPGGSYCNRVEAVPGFLVVTDVWDKSTYFPSDLVAEVIVESPRTGSW